MHEERLVASILRTARSHLSVQDFCSRYSPPPLLEKWILSCSNMEEVWDNAQPDDLFWIASQKGICSQQELLELIIFSLGLIKGFIPFKPRIQPMLQRMQSSHGSKTIAKEIIDTVMSFAMEVINYLDLSHSDVYRRCFKGQHLLDLRDISEYF